MFDTYSIHLISIVIAGLAVVSVFKYIPFVSEHAFWIMVAAYALLAGFQPQEEKGP